MLYFDDDGISKQHVTNISSANSYVRYKDLDKNNLIKCNFCRNYTDITCEQYDQDTLSAWLGLMRSSDDIRYVCKYCKSINEQIKFLSSQFEQNKKDLDEFKKGISDYKTRLSTIEKDLPAVTEKIFKPNKHNENGKQDKYIKEIA